MDTFDSMEEEDKNFKEHEKYLWIYQPNEETPPHQIQKENEKAKMEENEQVKMMEENEQVKLMEEIFLMIFPLNGQKFLEEMYSFEIDLEKLQKSTKFKGNLEKLEEIQNKMKEKKKTLEEIELKEKTEELKNEEIILEEVKKKENSQEKKDQENKIKELEEKLKRKNEKKEEEEKKKLLLKKLQEEEEIRKEQKRKEEEIKSLETELNNFHESSSKFQEKMKFDASKIDLCLLFSQSERFLIDNFFIEYQTKMEEIKKRFPDIEISISIQEYHEELQKFDFTLDPNIIINESKDFWLKFRECLTFSWKNPTRILYHFGQLKKPTEFDYSNYFVKIVDRIKLKKIKFYSTSNSFTESFCKYMGQEHEELSLFEAIIRNIEINSTNPPNLTHVNFNKNENIETTTWTEIGRREELEDEFVSILGKNYHFFGVFDGHGGNQSAKYCAKHLYPNLLQELKKKSYPDYFNSAFKKTDLDLISKSIDDGTTACTVLILEDSQKFRIFFANVGDSRCILIHENEVHRMSHDHKPTEPKELQRISKSKLSVARGRIQLGVGKGSIGVSRTFGDIEYKSIPNLVYEEQPVIAIPEIKNISITKGNSKNVWLVIACDGLWDVMSDEDVKQFVIKGEKNGKSLMTITKELVDFAIFEKESTDNVTVTIVKITK
jgi:protein phosphatase PTC2/3